MTKLAILSLVSAGLVPASLMAQTVAPPEPWQDVPDVELEVPATPPVNPVAPARPSPPPGVTWQRPVAPAPIPVRPAPTPAPQAQAAPPARVAPAPVPPAPARVVSVPMPPPAVAVRTAPPAPVAPRVPRVERGFIMPPYWMDPQFDVRAWDAYGFAAPAPDQRWLRYYDQALLVDRYGRVIDVRHDVDWGQRREAWAYDPRGVPVYVGDGDFYPDADDYTYVDGYDDDPYDYVYGGSCEATYGPGHYPPPACFQGGYPPYGYGYGWGGVTITETTVTTQGCCAEPQVVVKEYPARKVRHYKRKRAPRGEKG